jgi:hypothetical protein
MKDHRALQPAIQRKNYQVEQVALIVVLVWKVRVVDLKKKKQSQLEALNFN